MKILGVNRKLWKFNEGVDPGYFSNAIARKPEAARSRRVSAAYLCARERAIDVPRDKDSQHGVSSSEGDAETAAVVSTVSENVTTRPDRFRILWR